MAGIVFSGYLGSMCVCVFVVMYCSRRFCMRYLTDHSISCYVSLWSVNIMKIVTIIIIIIYLSIFRSVIICFRLFGVKMCNHFWWTTTSVQGIPSWVEQVRVMHIIWQHSVDMFRVRMMIIVHWILNDCQFLSTDRHFYECVIHVCTAVACWEDHPHHWLQWCNHLRLASSNWSRRRSQKRSDWLLFGEARTYTTGSCMVSVLPTPLISQDYLQKYWHDFSFFRYACIIIYS